MKKNEFVLDTDEMALMRQIEADEWIDMPMDEEAIDQYAQRAAYTKSLQEKRQTTIRFAVQDLAIIKAQAKEMGIGYQNLIQTLVHNYAHGKIPLGI
jgi:predicted DNA binding CopG/RHH family protein